MIWIQTWERDISVGHLWLDFWNQSSRNMMNGTRHQCCREKHHPCTDTCFVLLWFVVQVPQRTDQVYNISIGKSNHKYCAIKAKKKKSSQSCKPLGYYRTPCARGRASLTVSLLQWTARAFLRNKAETGPLLLRLAVLSGLPETSPAYVRPFADPDCVKGALC